MSVIKSVTIYDAKQDDIYRAFDATEDGLVTLLQFDHYNPLEVERLMMPDIPMYFVYSGRLNTTTVMINKIPESMITDLSNNEYSKREDMISDIMTVYHRGYDTGVIILPGTDGQPSDFTVRDTFEVDSMTYCQKMFRIRRIEHHRISADDFRMIIFWKIDILGRTVARLENKAKNVDRITKMIVDRADPFTVVSDNPDFDIAAVSRRGILVFKYNDKFIVINPKKCDNHQSVKYRVETRFRNIDAVISVSTFTQHTNGVEIYAIFHDVDNQYANQTKSYKPDQYEYTVYEHVDRYNDDLYKDGTIIVRKEKNNHE